MAVYQAPVRDPNHVIEILYNMYYLLTFGSCLPLIFAVWFRNETLFQYSQPREAKYFCVLSEEDVIYEMVNFYRSSHNTRVIDKINTCKWRKHVPPLRG